MLIEGGGNINRINRFQTPENVTEVINSYISDFEASETREKMRKGVDYYRSENTAIMQRQHYVYAEDDEGNPVKMIDPYRANNKLASGYFKLLVDQKINYLLGNEVTLETDDRQELEELIDDDFQQTLKQVGKAASKKAIGWVQVYIDDEGKFGYKKIPAEQVIPVYSVHNSEELELVIRYYDVRAMNEDGEVVRVTRVEVWDDEQVTYYQENTEDGLYHLLDEEQMSNIFGEPYSNPKYHFQKDLVIGDRVTEREGLAWGQVPFIPMHNNDEGDYDLQPVKRFIDAYDLVNSDFVNNLEDFQDVYWILKGYGGQNLKDFLNQVKKFKALKVAEDGDARAETIDIPTEARKEAKEGLERDIFTFGQGVNPNELEGGNITNVVIKSRFANLDLKCDQFEDEVKAFINRKLYFINRYREINNQEPIELDKIVFNRSMIMNEVELLDANAKQRGHISEDTRLSNHPWISDAEKEQEKMEQEIEDYVDLNDLLDDTGQDDEPDDGLDDGPEE